jgi:hypothetical protein
MPPQRSLVFDDQSASLTLFPGHLIALLVPARPARPALAVLGSSFAD